MDRLHQFYHQDRLHPVDLNLLVATCFLVDQLYHQDRLHQVDRLHSPDRNLPATT